MVLVAIFFMTCLRMTGWHGQHPIWQPFLSQLKKELGTHVYSFVNGTHLAKLEPPNHYATQTTAAFTESRFIYMTLSSSSPSLNLSLSHSLV